MYRSALDQRQYLIGNTYRDRTRAHAHTNEHAHAHEHAQADTRQKTTDVLTSTWRRCDLIHGLDFALG